MHDGVRWKHARTRCPPTSVRFTPRHVLGDLKLLIWVFAQRPLILGSRACLSAPPRNVGRTWRSLRRMDSAPAKVGVDQTSPQALVNPNQQTQWLALNATVIQLQTWAPKHSQGFPVRAKLDIRSFHTTTCIEHFKEFNVGLQEVDSDLWISSSITRTAPRERAYLRHSRRVNARMRQLEGALTAPHD